MQKREFLLVAVLYLFLGVAYFIALVVDTEWNNHHWTVLINHSLKALLTVPVWFLFFKLLKNQPLWKKGILHLVTLALFTFIWAQCYYALCEYFGLFYLKANRQIWDYYLTALFYIIQFGLFHTYDYYATVRSKDLIIAQQRQLTLQSELTALKAQLNPHFLYNVFNTINASIPAKAEHTRNMIAKLSDLFRYQLKASREEYVTIKEELGFVTKYLDLEKERFGQRLNFLVAVKEELLPYLMPPLIMQPLVENAVKHGISPLITGGSITISIQKDGDQVLFEIRDNGVGIDPELKDEVFTKGVGLSNTHQRLERMYSTGLEIADNDPSGLVVRFSIPSNHATQ
ncbi:MAG: histidine kinase [Bacteroidota bacterium]